ncbi:hypothetical protein pb186bvf_011553 [Paramecium bursaria]
MFWFFYLFSQQKYFQIQFNNCNIYFSNMKGYIPYIKELKTLN